MKSVMAHQFSRSPMANIPRSSFDRSHGYKTTFDAGYLVPFYVDEALPGDTHRVRTSGFARMSTPLYPVMDNMFMDTFYFSVPLRLLWDNFTKQMGEQVDPGDSTDYTTPIITSPAVTGHAEGSIYDYLGIPTQIAQLSHSALPLRAINLIWNEWFRDQNLQDSVTVNTDDGPDAPTDYALLRRGKRHDYFTSCLPSPQRGDSVDLPLGVTAKVKTSATTQFAGAQEPIRFTHIDGNTIGASADGVALSGTGGTYGDEGMMYSDNSTPVNPGQYDGVYPNNLFADLSNASAATINQLRQAFQLQVMYERDARGGTRYAEIIRSHFNVTDPLAYINWRPEYLGGGSTPINVHPVAQQTKGTGEYLGELGAFVTTSFNGHGFTKSFTEHSVIIGFVNVRADLTYQEGLNRMWSRETREDYYFPALAHIGEQAVLNKEIYADASATDDDVFGYQERYAEYRYKPSMVTGAFRSNAATPLDSWHLSEEFGTLPTLSDTFIQDDPPVDRVVAVSSEPHFIGDFYHNVRSVRPMPVYGIPGSAVGRF